MRVENLEVRMMQMESVQHQILGRLEALESRFMYLNPQMYGPSSARATSSVMPFITPSPFPHLQHTQVHLNASNSGLTGASIEGKHNVQPQMDNSEITASDSYAVGSIPPNPIPPNPITSNPVRGSLRAHAITALASSEIAKNTLRSVREVLEENVKLQTESSAGTLCQKLAKDAFFGRDVMRKCTPGGNRQYPALPQEELYELKKAMFQLFPRFHTCPGSFEPVWKKCLTSIEQACKRLRT